MNKDIVNKIHSYKELSKLKIMIPVSLTGFTGYFIFKPGISPEIIMVSLGIFLLAISASVLNQIQEVELDRKMKRTRKRPIPAGEIKVEHAVIFFLFNLIAGTIIISTWGNTTAAIIGLITILWYNGIYTYSKRITAFAVVPGAVTGALPPLIGWVAAGGGIWDKPIIFLEFLFFTGQIPHFWLLLLKYGEEYGKAGYPSLTNILSRVQINRLTFTWIVTSAMAALFLCYFEIIQNVPIVILLIIASVLLVWQFYGLIRISETSNSYRKYSILLDSYFLLIILLLITDRIIT
jgi:protoheme IX farnesyltransferase